MILNHVKLILLLLCMSFSFSCKRAINSSNSTVSHTEQKVNLVEPAVAQNASIDKILFINVECYKNKNGEDTCVLMNTIDANGKLKASTSDIHNHNGAEVNEYICSLLSCDGKVLYEEHMDNPLSSTMDTYEESGKIEQKQVNFDRREISLRVQKQEAFCKLKIEKKNKKGTSIICNTNLK